MEIISEKAQILFHGGVHFRSGPGDDQCTAETVHKPHVHFAGLDGHVCRDHGRFRRGKLQNANGTAFLVKIGMKTDFQTEIGITRSHGPG